MLTEGIKQLHQGIIGRVYLAKTWYTNKKKGHFPETGHCSFLARLRAMAGSCAAHALQRWPDPLRLALVLALGHRGGAQQRHARGGCGTLGPGVDFPTRVSSIGGRYEFKDDWETPDTQVIAMDYPGRISLVWESRSSNGRKIEGQDRGLFFMVKTAASTPVATAIKCTTWMASSLRK